MQKKIQKIFNQKKIFNTLEKNKLILNVIYKDSFFQNSLRIKIKQKIFLFNNQGSKSRIKNYCILTGRKRSVFRFFKLSRHKFRELASKKILPGIFKYSW